MDWDRKYIHVCNLHTKKSNKARVLQPFLILTFTCGCGFRAFSFEEAKRHATEAKHIVTFRGSYRAECRSIDGEFINRIPRSTEIFFSCGDGFATTLQEKAYEHIRKCPEHIVQVMGRISPALKESKCGIGPVPRPSKPVRVAGGRRRGIVICKNGGETLE